MSDNEDGFDSDDFDLGDFDDGFDDLDSNRSTLGDLWRNNAFVKIGVIFFGLALLIAIFMIFGGEKEKVNPSAMRKGSDVTEAPGGSEEMSDAIIKATEDDNTRKLEQALRQNDSFVPIPTNSTKGQIPFKPAKPDGEDPLERWRRLQEEKVDRAAVKKKDEPVEPEVDTRTPAIQALSEAMSQQMESILSNQKINGAQVTSIADLEYLEGLQKKEDDRLAAELKKRNDAIASSNNENEIDSDAILLPAGTIEYAQLITEANTDVPGPILAQVLTGPFKGARLIGSFEETYDYLTLNFNTIVLDGVDYSANGVAIDPDTSLPGVVTDIDRRYFTRVVLPVAAEFVSGFATAISESGQTTVVISGDGGITETTSNSNDNDQEVASGVATAGKELSSIIQEIKDNNPQLLRVRAGTPIGILFVEAVTNDEDAEVITPAERLQNLQLNNAFQNQNFNPNNFNPNNFNGFNPNNINQNQNSSNNNSN